MLDAAQTQRASSTPAPARFTPSRPPRRPRCPHRHRRPCPTRAVPVTGARARAGARTGAGTGPDPRRRRRALRRGDETIPFDNIRRRTAEHMVRSKATSAHVYTSVEVDFERVERVRAAHQAEWKARRASRSPTCRSSCARSATPCATTRNVNASVDGDTLVVHHDVHLGDRGRPRLRGPGRAGDPRRRRQAAAAHRPRDPRPRRPAPARSSWAPTRWSAARSRSPTWARSARTMTLPIINQPQVAILATDGIRKRPVVVEGPDGDDTIAIHHVGLLALAWDHRAFDGAYAASFLRAACGTVLEQPRLGSRARHDAAAGALARSASRTAKPTDLQRALHERAADDYLLLLEHPHVYTLGTTRRSRARARAAGDASAPSSCTPTAAATSRTTGPASSSATRSSRSPSGATASATSSRYVRALEAVLIDALADFGIDAHREPTAHRRVGRRREDRGDRREGRRRGARATGSRSTSIPTSRCSTTSSRAASATGASRRWPRCSGDAPDDARRRRRGRRRSSPRTSGSTPRSSARTSCGASTRRPQRVHARGDDRRRGAARRRRRCACSVGSPRPACATRSTARHAPARVDAGEGRPRRRLPRDEAPRAASSTCTRCARRPAARTSTSAGPTAPRRS